ncbi:MAG: hypothetical protein RSE01_02160 [Akkermansia sp.]
MRVWILALLISGTVVADIQSPSKPAPAVSVKPSVAPVVSVPTMRNQPAAMPSSPSMKPTSTPTRRGLPSVLSAQSKKTMQDLLAARTQSRTIGAYPWRFNITATVFWIGEQPTQNNPVPNTKSSWDAQWQESYGGYDDPDPEQRAPDFRPKSFIPRQNPFYVALPFNDVDHGSHKAESSSAIPWFRRDFEKQGQSVCKGKWVQIVYKNRYCFAQWEDCGPFTTEDWQYVFGNSPPQNQSNHGAAIDISPAVRDFLGIPGGLATVHWRFVDFHRIPPGPWARYGDNNPFRHPELNPMQKARRAQIELLRNRQKEIQQKLLKQGNLRRELQG